jgi:hypothetical protein
MSQPLKFCPSYSKATIKNAWFYGNYSIRFYSSGPSTSRLEVSIAIYSTRPASNTSTDPSDVPTALKLINLTVVATNAGLLFINSYLAKITIERVSIWSYN